MFLGLKLKQEECNRRQAGRGVEKMDTHQRRATGTSLLPCATVSRQTFQSFA